MKKAKRERVSHKSDGYLEYILYALKNYNSLIGKNGLPPVSSEWISTVEEELSRRRTIRAERERMRLEKEAKEGSATNRRRI